MKSYNKRIFAKYFFIILLFVFSNEEVFAAPTISSVAGVTAHNNSITINGSGYGQKNPAAPYFFDDFESGSNGASIIGKKGKIGSPTWEEYEGYGQPTYLSNQKYGTGSLSTGVSVRGDSFKSAGIARLNSSIVYFSMRYRWNANGTNWESAVYKPIRLTAQGGFYQPDPKFITQYQPKASWPYEAMTTGAGDGPQTNLPSASLSQNVWHRAEVYISLSTPAGTANGTTKSWHDFSLQYNQVNFVNRASSASSKIMDSFLLPFEVANNPSQTWNMWADDVYFDITQARVEIGDKQIFNQCTNREIQIPSAWSDSSITITTNQGNFKNGDSAYIFIVDSNGNMNSMGYPIVIGGGAGSASPAPAPPAGLMISN